MRARKFLFVTAVSTLWLSAIVGADTVSTWNAGSGNWSTAADWTPPVVPNDSGTTAYDVTIGATGTVGLDISPTITSLNLPGLLYAVPGVNPQLTVTNNALLNGAILFGASGPPPNGPGSLLVGADLTMGPSANLLVHDGSVVVGGNLTNAGFIGIVSDSGNDQFQVGGTLTNQRGIFFGNNRCFSVIGCPQTPLDLPGPIGGPTVTIGTLVNDGRINSWSNITASTLINNTASTTLNEGIISLVGNGVTVGTLQNAGTIYLASGCCSIAAEQTAHLNVGTGVTSSIGYNQSANGVLDEILSGSTSYGQIIAPPFFNPPGNPQGYPVNLNGTLDIMLQNGFIPTSGESFTLITTDPGDIFGQFSNVVWDSFDNGLGAFVISYDNAAGEVIATAELVPEPSSFGLLGGALLFVCFLARGYRASYSAARRRR